MYVLRDNESKSHDKSWTSWELVWSCDELLTPIWNSAAAAVCTENCRHTLTFVANFSSFSTIFRLKIALNILDLIKIVMKLKKDRQFCRPTSSRDKRHEIAINRVEPIFQLGSG